MKLLVLLAVLGAVSAQYTFYSGVTPFVNSYAPNTYTGHPLTYAGYPVTYTGYPATYTGYPFVHGLPLSFKPAEEKAADEDKPAVESRAKRSADVDQKAEDATYVSTYAGYPYPLTYTAGYPYTYKTYSSPGVYSSIYNPVAYSGLYNNLYHGYTAPVVHSLKKRDTAAAEADQKADGATFYSTFAAHPYTYNAGYPYTYSAAYRAPAVYSAPTPAVTYSGFNHAFPYAYRTFY